MPLTAVTGKSAMTYFGAQINEYKEVRQLHTRFPRPLKKAVLMAVQFRTSCCIERADGRN